MGLAPEPLEEKKALPFDNVYLLPLQKFLDSYLIFPPPLIFFGVTILSSSVKLKGKLSVNLTGLYKYELL